MPGARVELPPEVGLRYEVYVNGVLQQPGRDYAAEGRTLVFARPLAREGRLGFWRWLSLFLGIAGTYRGHENVDVLYEVGGQRHSTGPLPIALDDDAAAPHG